MDRKLYGVGAARGESVHACRLPILREVMDFRRDWPLRETGSRRGRDEGRSPFSTG